MIEHARSFINFAKDVFNATEQLIVPTRRWTVIHGELRLGNAVVMFSEANKDYPPFPSGIGLIFDKVGEIYQQAMAKGAVSLQEIGEREYGKRAGLRTHLETNGD